jgi:hypothetical protein
MKKKSQSIVLASSNYPFKTNALQPVYAVLRESTRLALHPHLVFLTLHRHPRSKAGVQEKVKVSDRVNERDDDA